MKEKKWEFLGFLGDFQEYRESGKCIKQIK